MKKFWAILITVAFITMAAMPAMAATEEERIAAIEKQLSATWKFYGSVRMGTFYNKFDAQDNHISQGGDGYDDKGTLWGQQTNTRIGARVTLGDISGHLEFGDNGGNYASRLIYATWNFGPGKLVIGKDYTPVRWDVNGKVYTNDNLEYGFGQFYGGREAQIKLIYGNFQFALIDPNTGRSLSGHEGEDTMIPRIEASYDLNFGPVTGRIVGGYKTYDVVDNEDLANEVEESVDAYILGLALKYAAGPFYAGVTGFYAQNIRAYAGGSMDISMGNNYVANGGDGYIGDSGYPMGDEDCKTFGFAAAIGYKVSDMITLEAGYGYQEDSYDFAGGDTTLEATNYYINMPITVAKNFWITPEIGIEQFKGQLTGGDSEKIGKSTYFGAKWQINF